MLIDFLRRSNKTLAAVFLGASTLILQSCGGGGASSDTGLQVGALSILPATGTMYASVPFELTLAGGRGPYRVISNEQTVLPINALVNGNRVTVVPNNPGVVDPNTDPLVVPSRSVTVTVRDNAGAEVTGTYNVLQNFMTGYTVSVNSISRCGVVDPAVVVPACAGFESRVDVRPTSAGLLRAQRQLRFTVLYGPLAYIQDDNVTLASSYLLTTDSNGNGVARFVPTTGALTQYVAIRVTDVQTTAYRDIVMTLLSAPTGPLTAIPDTLPALTGANSAQCGFGTGTIVVTGGLPPYNLTTTSPGIIATPTRITSNAGSSSISYGGGIPPNCTQGQVVVTDSAGSVVTVTANSSPGTVAPVVALNVLPNSFCFTAAGQTGTSQVTGGNSAKVINSSNTAVATVGSATGAGNFPLTITAGAALGTASVSINDGAGAVIVTVTRAAVCP